MIFHQQIHTYFKKQRKFSLQILQIAALQQHYSPCLSNTQKKISVVKKKITSVKILIFPQKICPG